MHRFNDKKPFLEQLATPQLLNYNNLNAYLTRDDNLEFIPEGISLLLVLPCQRELRHIYRLAKQVAAFYQDVRGMLSGLPLSQHFDRSWYSHATVKATLYEAETQSQAAIGLHAEQEVAPEISRIKARPLSLLC